MFVSDERTRGFKKTWSKDHTINTLIIHVAATTYTISQEVGVYLDLSDDVGSQLDHGKVPLPDDLLELIEADLFTVGGVLRRHRLVSLCEHVCVCRCVCVCVCVCMMRACVCICVYICVCVHMCCVCACVCARVCIYW